MSFYIVHGIIFTPFYQWCYQMDGSIYFQSDGRRCPCMMLSSAGPQGHAPPSLPLCVSMSERVPWESWRRSSILRHQHSHRSEQMEKNMSSYHGNWPAGAELSVFAVCMRSGRRISAERNRLEEDGRVGERCCYTGRALYGSCCRISQTPLLPSWLTKVNLQYGPMYVLYNWST